MRNLEGGYQFHKNQIGQPNQHADCRRRSQKLELPTELPQSAGWLPAVVLPPTLHKLYDDDGDPLPNLAVIGNCVRVHACYFSAAYLSHVT